MHKTPSELYRTRDLAEAAALIVCNQAVSKVEREHRTCWFIFNNKPQCELLVNQYSFGKLLVNARDYYDALNRLKTIVFHGQK